ncbi:hypothetical protein BY458DRAFT_544211 [Sporodiniella umbellata]|nr:hypothetical protein BY458DRAFT_544211 [Sporodiniella umbellata]
MNLNSLHLCRFHPFSTRLLDILFCHGLYFEIYITKALFILIAGLALSLRKPSRPKTKVSFWLANVFVFSSQRLLYSGFLINSLGNLDTQCVLIIIDIPYSSIRSLVALGFLQPVKTTVFLLPCYTAGEFALNVVRLLAIEKPLYASQSI